jgi:mRNA interferase MazF
MIIHRGDIWWAELAEPRASEPGFRRPVLIVQADAFNRSRIQTVLAVALTTNLKLAEAPGNVLIPAEESGLSKDSVANVSQMVTLDKQFLTEKCGRLTAATLRVVDEGLRLVLAL